MHYYHHDISKYRRKTGHLTILEHGIYRQLLDTYYMQEGPLDKDLDKVMRHHGVRTEDEKQAFDNVMQDFFSLQDDGYHNDQADDVLAQIYEKSAKARESAQKRWEKEKNRGKNANASAENANASDNNANASETDANGMLLNNQTTITTGQQKTSDPPGGESSSQDAEDIRCAEWMFALIRDVMPKEKQPKFDKWANTIRLMRERDGYSRKEIATVFKWANQHHFWKTNIRGPDKLRKQFPVLDRQRQDDETGRRNGPGGSRPLTRTEQIDRDIDNDFGNAHG